MYEYDNITAEKAALDFILTASELARSEYEDTDTNWLDFGIAVLERMIEINAGDPIEVKVIYPDTTEQRQDFSKNLVYTIAKSSAILYDETENGFIEAGALQQGEIVRLSMTSGNYGFVICGNLSGWVDLSTLKPYKPS
jgi:hypothetical protein